MADPAHHAESSVKKWGGKWEDYIKIHQWFDESKAQWTDPRHRALRHHAEGIAFCVQVFGVRIPINAGRGWVPTRWIAEQHVMEDLGRIPTMRDWFEHIAPQPWMNRPLRLSRTLALDAQDH